HRPRACAGQGPRRSRTISSQRSAAGSRRSDSNPRGSGMGSCDPTRADARRSAGILAHRTSPDVAMHSEDVRQWVHVGSAAFAVLLRWLSWWQAAALAVAALLLNLVLLPRVRGQRLYRPIDEARG